MQRLSYPNTKPYGDFIGSPGGYDEIAAYVWGNKGNVYWLSDDIEFVDMLNYFRPYEKYDYAIHTDAEC